MNRLTADQVIRALLHQDEPLTAAEIAAWTGYAPKTVGCVLWRLKPQKAILSPRASGKGRQPLSYWFPRETV